MDSEAEQFGDAATSVSANQLWVGKIEDDGTAMPTPYVAVSEIMWSQSLGWEGDCFVVFVTESESDLCGVHGSTIS